MSTAVDVIVVGSGPSAVNAAYPLVQAGRTVAMLDVGHEDTVYRALIPQAPFAEVRRSDPRQHRYFLGDRFEGVPLGVLGAAPQLIPPRQYVLRDTDALLPTQAPGFAALQSLALGGLGGAWGAGCFPLLDNELVKCGLSPGAIRPHFEEVARRIGVSGTRDDLEPFWGPLDALQPPLALDHNATRILRRYRQQRTAFHSAGLFLGRPRMAVLTRPLGGREANPYHDMDFWTNHGGSVFRPEVLVRELERYPNFRYLRPYLVERFREAGPGQVTVQAQALTNNSVAVFQAARVVLAAGAMSTTRIVLRSLERYNVPVPLTCNAHSYTPCLHLGGLGRRHAELCHSLAQLTLIYDPTGDREHLVQAQFFSYRSLLLFRLLNDSPLCYRESLRVLRALAPAFVILVLQHEDYQGVNKHCVLRRHSDGSDVLEINYRPQRADERRQQRHEQVIRTWLRRLGCFPLRSARPPHGSSVHYGSQLATTVEDRPLTCTPSGRLRGTDNVYVADGAALAYLPAKGLTGTLMANASRVAANIAGSLRSLSG